MIIKNSGIACLLVMNIALADTIKNDLVLLTHMFKKLDQKIVTLEQMQELEKRDIDDKVAAEKLRLKGLRAVPDETPAESAYKISPLYTSYASILKQIERYYHLITDEDDPEANRTLQGMSSVSNRPDLLKKIQLYYNQSFPISPFDPTQALKALDFYLLQQKRGVVEAQDGEKLKQYRQVLEVASAKRKTIYTPTTSPKTPQELALDKLATTINMLDKWQTEKKINPTTILAPWQEKLTSLPLVQNIDKIIQKEDLSAIYTEILNNDEETGIIQQIIRLTDSAKELDHKYLSTLKQRLIKLQDRIINPETPASTNAIPPKPTIAPPPPPLPSSPMPLAPRTAAAPTPSSESKDVKEAKTIQIKAMAAINDFNEKYATLSAENWKKQTYKKTQATALAGTISENIDKFAEKYTANKAELSDTLKALINQLSNIIAPTTIPAEIKKPLTDSLAKLTKITTEAPL